MIARIPLRLLASLLCALSAGSACARATLTLDEAQRVAVDHSRQVAAQDAVIASSREKAVAARRLPDPVATIGVNNLPVDGPN